MSLQWYCTKLIFKSWQYGYNNYSSSNCGTIAFLNVLLKFVKGYPTAIISFLITSVPCSETTSMVRSCWILRFSTSPDTRIISFPFSEMSSEFFWTASEILCRVAFWMYCTPSIVAISSLWNWISFCEINFLRLNCLLSLIRLHGNY